MATKKAATKVTTGPKTMYVVCEELKSGDEVCGYASVVEALSKNDREYIDEVMSMGDREVLVQYKLVPLRTFTPPTLQDFIVTEL